MLYFDRIDVSEKIDVNKKRVLKECDICHYWYFSIKGFKFQSDVCNGCLDLLMMSIKLGDIAILHIEGADCRCIINGIIKSETTNLTQNIDLTKKSGILYDIKFFYHI